MPRPPKARLAILDAAERIVKERGAANLTYEELVVASGISRGGITYHFATKDDLLRALIARDLEQWQEREQQCRRGMGSGDRSGDLVAELRTLVEPDPEKQRFVAGMLSAVAHDRSLLAPVREREAARQPACWTNAEIDRLLLKMAGAGLFWTEVFGCSEFAPEVRARLVARLEQLATGWCSSIGLNFHSVESSAKESST